MSNLMKLILISRGFAIIIYCTPALEHYTVGIILCLYRMIIGKQFGYCAGFIHIYNNI